MKILQVINSAYRATIEEQDDTVVWLAPVMACVNYSVVGQDASGLAFGDWQQTQPPHIARDVGSLPAKGVQVFVLDEDAQELGVTDVEQLADIGRISRKELPELYSKYDQIWQW